MKPLLRSILGWFLSPGEMAALQSFRMERAIASYHRAGLRQMRRQSLSRPTRLNLGSGGHRKEGFLNVDLLPPADLTVDLRRGLPFDSDCCELVFSEHFFEHVDYPEPVTLLFRECLRVLQPGGLLRFSVPGTEWPLTDYREGADAPYFNACEQHDWHPAYCTTRLEHINYHFRQDGDHRFAYDYETAEKALNGAGFTEVKREAFDPSFDASHREVGSLFVSARKPG